MRATTLRCRCGTPFFRSATIVGSFGFALRSPARIPTEPWVRLLSTVWLTMRSEARHAEGLPAPDELGATLTTDVMPG